MIIIKNKHADKILGRVSSCLLIKKCPF